MRADILVVAGLLFAACGSEFESEDGDGGVTPSPDASAAAGGGSGAAASGGDGGSVTGGRAGSATGGRAGAGTGGSAGTPPGGSGGTASGGNAGSASGGQPGASACPSSPPASGGPCDPPGLGCSYGDDPRYTCRTFATCAQDGWTVNLVTPGGACAQEPLPSSCPPAAPASLDSCTELGLSCTYPDGPSCLCTDCDPNAPSCQQGPSRWYCTGNSDPNCPGIAPNAGIACSPTGTTCNYTCDLIATCGDDGYWQWDRFNCPDCASPDTPVATPLGERPIASLREGDEVYTVHRGEVAVAPIVRVSSRPAHRHHVMRILLETGAVLEISPGHPTADGRSFGDLRPGALPGGLAITNAELVPYRHERTYDILPESDSGAYFAAGMIVGSTLRRDGTPVTRVAPECR